MATNERDSVNNGRDLVNNGRDSVKDERDSVNIMYLSRQSTHPLPFGPNALIVLLRLCKKTNYIHKSFSSYYIQKSISSSSRSASSLKPSKNSSRSLAV